MDDNTFKIINAIFQFIAISITGGLAVTNLLTEYKDVEGKITKSGVRVLVITIIAGIISILTFAIDLYLKQKNEDNAAIIALDEAKKTKKINDDNVHPLTSIRVTVKIKYYLDHALIPSNFGHNVEPLPLDCNFNGKTDTIRASYFHFITDKYGEIGQAFNENYFFSLFFYEDSKWKKNKLSYQPEMMSIKPTSNYSSIYYYSFRDSSIVRQISGTFDKIYNNDKHLTNLNQLFDSSFIEIRYFPLRNDEFTLEYNFPLSELNHKELSQDIKVKDIRILENPVMEYGKDFSQSFTFPNSKYNQIYLPPKSYFAYYRLIIPIKNLP